MITFPFINSLPKPKSRYLVSLSTPFGIMQHTSFNLADPHFGYAADDNARALITANFLRHENRKYLASGQSGIFEELEERYLRFLKFMQDEKGKFYCYLTFDLKKKELGTGDWFARTLFALSFIIAKSESFDKPALSIVWRSLPIIFEKQESFSLRTRAYLLLTFYYLFKEQKAKGSIFKKREEKLIFKIIKKWGKNSLERLKKHEDKKWVWPEKRITYDNGKIIQLYFLLGKFLNKEKFINEGERVLEFYLAKTMRKEYFQAPGNYVKNNVHKFWEKGKPFPVFDEQPIEAYSLISALVSAYLLTKKQRYLKKAKKAYLWFFGKNRLEISLVDKKTGAVYDGLRKKGININKGAESYLSLNLAYFNLKTLLHL